MESHKGQKRHFFDIYERCYYDVNQDLIVFFEIQDIIGWSAIYNIKKMISKISNVAQNVIKISKYFYGITPQFLHPLDADLLLNQSPKSVKRTKTVCTIGPKTQHPDNAGKLIDEGLSVARLNFSHGDHAEHYGQMAGVRQALKSRPFEHTSILLDTKGPEIRTGNMVDGKPIILERGQSLELTTDYGHLGTNKRIAVSYTDLAKTVKSGNKILFADGGVSSVVRKVENGIVTVQILNDGKLGNKKNMCLPGVKITLPTIGDYDQHDIIEFGLKHKIDYIAVSFARYGSDLVNLRKLLKERDPVHGPNIHLISKIQNHEAIHNIDQIIEHSDGIMVARGDLGMEVPIEKVVLLQKYIMGKTIDAGKYVICATQMLESMETKPRPTRAEVSDITNSILDLTDATMTSGETTMGAFPTEAARMLRLIAEETELTTAYKRIFEYKKKFLSKDKEALGAISLSFEITADLIFLETENIQLINRLSSLRPRAYICVFTDNPTVKRLTAINFGVYCFPKQYAKNEQEFVKTIGAKFLVNNRPETVILHVRVNQRGEIRSHHINHIPK